MSVFDRINQIENRMNSLENALTLNEKKPGVSANSPEAVSFQKIMGSMTAGQRFDPSAVNNAGSAPVNNDPKQYDSIIAEASQKYNVDESLIRAVIRQESAFNPQATSYCGAQGMMQLMPETAAELGVKNAYDARENIMGGTKYLSRLLDQFDGNMTKAIAAYNAGPGAVQQHGGVPPYPETQNYVDKVLGYYQQNKGIHA